jgi:hypothetical protein
MATKIVTKNSSTASAVPTASDLVQGELAVNVTDKRLFTEDNAGAIVELGTNPSTIDINAGTIDGTAIGASSASTGAFTTLTATGAFTSRGIDDNADATAITIDSSENVGIGTASPSSYYSTTLVVDAPDEDGITVVSPTTGTGYLMFADGTSGNERYRGYINYGHANDDMQFATSGLTRMRIDSSGNVLVGTTSTDPAASSTETGVALKGGGFVSISRYDSAATVNINKIGYDGSLVDFRKDGSTVGSIGVDSGSYLVIESEPNGSALILEGSDNSGTTTRLAMQNASGSEAFRPFNSHSDALFDLGSSARRFKDLYLSGTGYFGTSVGIGTSSPAYELDVKSSGEADIRIDSATGNDGALRFAENGTNVFTMYHDAANSALAFYDNANTSERMRIDASGNVKINAAGSLLIRDDGTFIKESGGLQIGNTSGTGTTRPILFYTESAERMRIDSSGNLLVGTTSSSGKLTVRQDSTTASPLFIVNAAISGKFATFEGNGAVHGSITWSGSTTSYNTSSDYRLKENIADADDAGSKVDAIQVRKFDWKADGSHQDYGMIAQELQVVAPEAVSAPEDPDEMMGVDYSKLVPMLIKEIQSLRNRVAQLEE